MKPNKINMFEQLSAEFVAYGIIFLIFITLSISFNFFKGYFKRRKEKLKNKEIREGFNIKNFYKRYKKWIIIVLAISFIAIIINIFDYIEEKNRKYNRCNDFKNSLSFSPEKNAYYKTYPKNLVSVGGKVPEIYKGDKVIWYKDNKKAFEDCINR